MDKVNFLLVDDIEENLTALEALLRREDLEIFKARSGTQALELVLEHDFALAFIDVQMPEMDGFELAELMRGSERSKHIPLIFVTASAQEPNRVFRGYETGAIDFLFKPIDPNIIRNKADTFFQLYRQKQELEQALKVRDTLLAVVSHDLRNPLSTLYLNIESLQKKLSNESIEPIVQHQLKTAQRSAERMDRLIADLVDMAGIQTGRISVKRAPQDVGTLVNEALALHKEIAQKQSIPLHKDTPAEEVCVLGDRDRILQVFSNLLGNAFKFCRAGTPIRIRAEESGPEVRFAVADSGPGIVKEDLPYLFEPYWSAKKHERQGMGLGLFISKGIVEAHGGHIWVESNSGGTTFFFTLPTAR